MQKPFYPIIYVRGYAMTEAERNETAADPFCGFNLGSTIFRANPNKHEPAKKFVFESPLLRLSAEYGYSDVYENGLDILDPDWRPRTSMNGQPNLGIPASSVVIYRYYDEGSSLLGDGEARKIEHYCAGLSALILRVRDLVVAQERGARSKPEDFRCYLVAHSMGGLVVRGFLQNPRLGSDAARKAVDKIFTYATPHNGIDAGGRNVPSWLGLSEINTFNRERMGEYLNLEAALERYKRVDFLPAAAFPIERIFCMVGTNRDDYDVAMGLSRTFAGHGSDGLVKVDNASVWGLDRNNNISGTAATAYCYRTHSGPFGIVNSEESYQNLSRFLFGDVRVDLWIEVDEVRLPVAIEDKPEVQALYQFELLARPRGKRWYLSRRVAEEDSPACRNHAELTQKKALGGNLVYLSTVFLANKAKVSTVDRTLAYAMDVSVRVPDYVIDRKFWADQHFEGSHLFRDSLLISLEPPEQDGGAWKVMHSWESQHVGQATQELSYTQVKGGQIRIEVPMPTAAQKPGIDGKILLLVSAWNND